MAESVVSNVAARLEDLVIEEAKFLRGVADQVKHLQMELVWMKSFLKEADSRQAENEMVRMWVAEIREIAYDAEDLRQSYPHMKEPNAVGLDNAIKELVSVLVDEGRHFRVASICGMGGLGKTTLAKKVYHHAQVRNHFKHFVWAYISQQCQRRTVWRGILSSLGLIDEKGGILLDMGDQDLAAKLYEFLKENKCLVVLDDIWTTEDWDAISPAFPMEEETGSKILLTSRNKDVAWHADPRGCLHELQFLTDEDSYVIEEKMEELGKDMVKQCAGLPLAIVVLGGILVTKHSLNDWQIVHENVKSYLRRGRSWGIHEAIALSYDNLPPHLKPCFLYLSVFPEDYKIHVGKLIKLWVAEDIVSLADSEENGEEMIEDVAEGYLSELVERYMVLVGERDRELLERSPLSKWLGEEDYGESFTIVDACLESLRWVSWLCELRHKTRGLTRYICNNFKLLRILDFGDANILFLRILLLSDIGSLIHLRFLSLGRCAFAAMLPSFISKLRFLQTLDLRDCVGVYVPNVLWKMERLRHLYLPQKMVSTRTKLKLNTLKNLQTLVNFNTKNCYLENIYCMKYLRELGIRTPFIVENFKEDSNLNMPVIISKHLRSLSIIKNDDDHESIDPRHLTYLLSSCHNVCELHLSAEIRKLPEPQHIPSNIAHIYLARAMLDEDPLPTLQNLPNLRILELEESAFVGKVMICSAQGFPLLHSLSIISQTNLEELRVNEGAMPNLHHLRIADCRKLKMLPNELRFVTTLKELKIEGMPKAFKDKLVEGGEDSYKVQHVPSIIFQNCEVVKKKPQSLFLLNDIPNSQKLFLVVWRLEWIGSLVHLRFLSFGNCLFVAMLPSFISKLRCLQTLDLRNCVGVYVPNVLWKLEGLRHLYLPKVIVCSKTKLKLDTLKNLQTLVNFNTENCYLENIYCMKYLRELRIITPFIVENFKEDLNLNPPIITSKHLRSLSIIKNDDDHESIDPRHLTYLFSGSLNICELHLSAKIRKLPEPQHIPSNIAHIYLGWARLDEDPLPTLQNLPNLRILELEENAFVGKVMICSAQGFPLLNALSIISQSNLEELRVSEGAMPNLHHLRIVNCRMLKMLPFISTLKELKIEKMPKAFKDKLVEGGEDSYKVQHVPSIIFQNCDD
ncbi:NB-ARC - like 10 [Theobroma cacao]|nr:NB-ARC - like 10 [Theobroma cacao]